MSSQIPRRDIYLEEAIAILDIRLAEAKGSTYEAYQSLNHTELKLIDEELEKCLNFRYYAENYHVIGSEADGFKTLYPFWDSQEIFYEVVYKLQQDGKPVKIIVLKARQLGQSTISQALIFHKTIFKEACNTLVVAQDPSQADYLFGMSRLAYDSLPWWMRPERRYEAKGRYIVFDRNDPVQRLQNPGLRSQIFVEAANKLCLCPGTKVLSARGMVLIETIVPGDFVYDPNCRPIKVVASLAKISPRKTGKKITAWYNAAFPVCGTDDHPLMTPTGLRQMQDFDKGDRFVIPFRKITSGEQIPAPRMSRHAICHLKRSLTPLPNREWGFLCGLYLAEGSVDKGNGRPVSFGLSSSEHHLARRASEACRVKLSKPIKIGGGLIYRIHSSWLGTWLSQEFGTADGKRVPDWAFGCGVEFCLGLFEGMILGDGHSCKARNDIVLVTVRSLLALQFRELALALGFGLGGIMQTKTAWTHKGEKRTGIGYRVEWGGDVGISIRCALGLLVHSVKKHLRNHRKWGWIDGKNAVWVEVKSIETYPIDIVYDIQVDSEDHLYLLPSTITHNTGVSVGKTIHAAHMSEMSSWNDPKILAEQIFPTMNAPDELAIMESTARGRKDFFHKFWNAAWAKKVDWIPVFIEFFRVKKYSTEIPVSVKLELTPEEKALRNKVEKTKKIFITDEQFYWRRKKMEEFVALQGDDSKFFQEYPSGTWIEAFQGSGICGFNKKKLQMILDTTCEEPVWFGEITLLETAKGPQPKINLTMRKEGESIPPAEEHGARLRVWEKPIDGEKYYIGGDVAHGVQGGNFSCAQVLRIGRAQEPDVQVAEWHGWINPTPYAYVLAALGYWYNTAEVAVECNDVGIATNNHLRMNLEYPQLFRWKHYDKIKNFITDYFGWFTNNKTRDLIISKFREGMDDATIVLRSEDLLDECLDFGAENDDSRFEAQEGMDDRVFGIMIAYHCAHDSEWGKAAAMAPRNPLDASNKNRDYVNSDFSPLHDGGSMMRVRPNPVTGELPKDLSMYEEMDHADAWKNL